MGGGALTKAALVAVALLVPFPAGAGAASEATAEVGFGAEELSGVGFVAQLQVPGARKEDRLSVFTGRRAVSIYGIHRGTLVDYSAPGQVSKRRVRVGFGRFGSVSIRFEADGPPRAEPPPRTCAGGPLLQWKGTFRGSVVFRPKGGLPHVVDRGIAVRGSLLHWPKWRCSGEDGPTERASGPRLDDERGVELVAEECGRRGFAATGVQSVSPGSGPLPGPIESPSFSAYATEKVGRVQIGYSASNLLSNGAFSVDAGLTEATVEPTPPFRGSATYKLDPQTGASSWTGDLSVSFPGLRVALAGPGLAPSIESFPVFEGGYANTIFGACEPTA